MTDITQNELLNKVTTVETKTDDTIVIGEGTSQPINKGIIYKDSITDKYYISENSFTTIGSPSITDGIASGFSASNYFTIKNNFEPTSLKIVVKASSNGSQSWGTLVDMDANDSVFRGHNNNIIEFTRTGTIIARIDSLTITGHSFWSIVDIGTGKTNKLYVLIDDDNTYTIDTIPALDSNLWTTADFNTSALTLSAFITDIFAIGNNRKYSRYWNGSIDLNNSAIWINDTKIWNKTDNFYMSNITTGTGYVKNISKNNTSMCLGGKTTTYNNNVAIGYNSETPVPCATAIGSNSYAYAYGVAVGDNSHSEMNGVAIGRGAVTRASGAIQLGGGTNTTTNTVQIKNYTLVEASGKISNDRLKGIVFGNQLDKNYISQGATTFTTGNVEVMNGATITDGIVIGNGTNGAYGNVSVPLTYTTSCELVAKGIVTATTGWINFLCCDEGNLCIGIWNGKTYFNGPNVPQDMQGDYTFSANDVVWLKLTYSDLTYKMYYSYDGENYIQTASYQATSNPSTTFDHVQISRYGSAQTYIVGSYCILDGVEVWRGAIEETDNVAKATDSLYGLVKPDNATITVNNGVISTDALRNTATGTNSLTIGGTATNATASVNIGIGSVATGATTVAIGQNARSTATQAYEIGTGTNSDHHTLRIGFFINGALVGYTLLDGNTGKIPGSRMSLQDISAPTTSTVGSVGQFYIDTTNQDAYICVKADTTAPEYIWKKITT